MIEVEAVFDGDSITVNGEKFFVYADYGYDTHASIDDKDKTFDTIEKAVAYCLEQSK